MPETLTVNPAVEALIGQIKMVSRLYAADLNAMPHEMLDMSIGGKARSGYDVTYEVAWVNQLVGENAKGNEIPFEEPEGWVQAPAEFRTKEAAIANYENSIASVISGLEGADEATLAKVVPSPLGPTPLLQLAQIIPSHIMYHSGQLNLIQTYNGDDAFHWAM